MIALNKNTLKNNFVQGFENILVKSVAFSNLMNIQAIGTEKKLFIKFINENLTRFEYNSVLGVECNSLAFREID